MIISQRTEALLLWSNYTEYMYRVHLCIQLYPINPNYVNPVDFKLNPTCSRIVALLKQLGGCFNPSLNDKSPFLTQLANVPFYHS